MSQDYIVVRTYSNLESHNEQCNKIIAQGYLPLGPINISSFSDDNHIIYVQTLVSEALYAKLSGHNGTGINANISL